MDSEDIVKFIRGKSDDLECANAEIKQLRQRVAELETNFKVEQIAHLSLTDLLEKELAASKLENKRLRSALTYVIDDLELRASLKWDKDERDVVDIGNGAYTQAKEALREPTDTEALETYVADRLGEPVAWRGMTGHGAVISVNPPAIQPDNWTPLYALKDKS